jgi:hypothetical protein
MLTPLRTKLSDFVHQVIALRPKSGGAATTLSANSAAAATTFTATSPTGLTDTDAHRVGSEEDAEIVVQSGAPAGSVVTIRAPGFKRAHVIGEAVTELSAFDLGNAMGVRDGSSADVADNDTDVARNPDGRRLGHLMFQPQFDLQGYSPWHFALLTGMPLARMLGAGTSADPHQVHTDGTDFGSEDTGIILVERLHDGTYLRHEFDACGADYTQLAIALGQGRETLLAARFVASNHPQWTTGLPQFAIDTTQQVRKTHQLEALLECGWFRVLSGGLSTTLTGPVALDANVFPVTSATGIVGGKWYRVVGGGKTQIIFVESLSVLNVTTRTRAAYAFPTGSTFVEMEQVPFGGLKEGTTEFRVGGALKAATKFDNMRVQAGVRPGSALFTLNVQPTTRTLEVLRQQHALPTAAIVGGTSLVHSDLAGTDAPIGWYARAQRKDAKTVYLVGSGVDNGLETLEKAMAMRDLNSVPMSFRNQLLSTFQW